MKAHYNSTTFELLGWYGDDDLNIPTPNTNITEEKWKDAININANYVDIDNAEVIIKDLRTFGKRQANLLDKLNRKSKEIMTEDLDISGTVITTDASTVSEITSALSLLGRNPNDSIDFRAKTGWAVANKATLEAMQDAIWIKQKSTRANEKVHEEAITLLTTVEQVAAYDLEVGW